MIDTNGMLTEAGPIQFRDMATDPPPTHDGWISRCLFAIKRKYGWEVWVGQRDDVDIWLGHDHNGTCWECDAPTHWAPLPPMPDDARPTILGRAKLDAQP